MKLVIRLFLLSFCFSYLALAMDPAIPIPTAEEKQREAKEILDRIEQENVEASNTAPQIEQANPLQKILPQREQKNIRERKVPKRETYEELKELLSSFEKRCRKLGEKSPPVLKRYYDELLLKIENTQVSIKDDSQTIQKNIDDLRQFLLQRIENSSPCITLINPDTIDQQKIPKNPKQIKDNTMPPRNPIRDIYLDLFRELNPYISKAQRYTENVVHYVKHAVNTTFSYVDFRLLNVNDLFEEAKKSHEESKNKEYTDPLTGLYIRYLEIRSKIAENGSKCNDIMGLYNLVYDFYDVTEKIKIFKENEKKKKAKELPEPKKKKKKKKKPLQALNLDTHTANQYEVDEEKLQEVLEIDLASKETNKAEELLEPKKKKKRKKKKKPATTVIEDEISEEATQVRFEMNLCASEDRSTKIKSRPLNQIRSETVQREHPSNELVLRKNNLNSLNDIKNPKNREISLTWKERRISAIARLLHGELFNVTKVDPRCVAVGSKTWNNDTTLVVSILSKEFSVQQMENYIATALANILNNAEHLFRQNEDLDAFISDRSEEYRVQFEDLENLSYLDSALIPSKFRALYKSRRNIDTAKLAKDFHENNQVPESFEGLLKEFFTNSKKVKFLENKEGVHPELVVAEHLLKSRSSDHHFYIGTSIRNCHTCTTIFKGDTPSLKTGIQNNCLNHFNDKPIFLRGGFPTVYPGYIFPSMIQHRFKKEVEFNSMVRKIEQTGVSTKSISRKENGLRKLWDLSDSEEDDE